MTTPIKECHKETVIVKLFSQIASILDPRSRLQACLLILAMFLVGIAELIGLLLIPVLIMLLAYPAQLENRIKTYGLDAWLPAQDLYSHLSLYLLVLTIFFVGKNLFSSGLVYMQTLFQTRAHRQLSQRLLASFLSAPYEHSLNASSSRQLHLITVEVPRLFNSVVGPMFVLLTESIICLILGLTLLFFDPFSFLSVTLLVVGSSAAFYFFLRRRITRLGKIQSDLGQKTAKIAAQSLGGLKEIKVLGREGYFLGQFDQSSSAYIRSTRVGSSFKLYPKYFIESIIILGITVMIGIMLAYGQKDQVTILGGLSFFAVSAIRLAPCLSRIVAASNDILGARSTLEDICGSLNQTPLPVVTTGAPLTFSKNLEFKNVSYSYPGTSIEILSNLNFVLGKGSTMALVGPSGAGKTTLANALLGLLPVSIGQILVDGQSIETNPGSWQKKIGYIPQSIYLADDSIRHNIAFGIPDQDIDDALVMEAVEAAQLRDLIQSLPNGLDQYVGERGIRLSGGQIQRIGIARALYRRPEILVMDEATSALDNQTEQQITSILGKLHGQKTIFIIAHRLSTIKNADKILFLQKDSKLEQGAYHNLYQTSPAFAAMVDAGNQA